MAEYPIHPYIIHCLELLLANAAAPVVLALDGRCGSGKTTMATALAEQFPDSIVLHTDDFYLPPADRVPGWEQTPCANMDLARLRDEVLAPAIRSGQRILVAAHGNSIRAMVKMLDGISDADIVNLNIPNGIPLVYELDADLKPIRSYYLGDAEAAAKAAAAVAAQGKR